MIIQRKKRIAIPGKDGGYNNYRLALEGAGTLPVMIRAREEVDRIRDCEGLLLPGGADMDPALYGQENRGSMGIDRENDEIQFSSLRIALEMGIPVLGVCKGHQVINVCFGGELIQDIPQRVRHTMDRERGMDRVHQVKVAEGSWLAGLYGSGSLITVNSSHHQAVSLPGQGLRIAAVSDDGIVEGLWHESLPVFSIQWHPERWYPGYFEREGKTDLMKGAEPSAPAADGMRIYQWFADLL